MVEPGALHEVGAVEAGTVDAHQDLTGTRLGIGAFLDSHLLVGDHERAHAATVVPGHLRGAGAEGYGAAVPDAADRPVAELVVLDADGQRGPFRCGRSA